MAYVAVPGGIIFPRIPRHQLNTPTITTVGTIADADDKIGFVIQCPKAGVLKRVQFRVDSVTTSNDLRVSFQGVEATAGNPDGVVGQFRVVTGIAAHTWFTTGIMTSDGTDTGAKRTVSKGELLAIVIGANAIPISLGISCFQLDNTANAHNFPYCLPFTTAWITKTGRVSCLALQYDDDSYAEIWGDPIPIQTIGTDSIGTGSTPDEIGLKFKLPFGCKVDGFWFKSSANVDHQVVLYDTDGIAVLTSLTIDKDIKTANNNFDNYRLFPAEVALLPNVFYRLVIKPTTVSTISLLSYITASAEVLDMMDGGQNFHYTSRTDAGAWTDVTTRRPYMGLRISAIDAAVTGGGAFSAAYA